MGGGSLLVSAPRPFRPTRTLVEECIYQGRHRLLLYLWKSFGLEGSSHIPSEWNPGTLVKEVLKKGDLISFDVLYRIGLSIDDSNMLYLLLRYYMYSRSLVESSMTEIIVIGYPILLKAVLKLCRNDMHNRRMDKPSVNTRENLLLCMTLGNREMYDLIKSF
jgi:hypothetical protein